MLRHSIDFHSIFNLSEGAVWTRNFSFALTGNSLFCSPRIYNQNKNAEQTKMPRSVNYR